MIDYEYNREYFKQVKQDVNWNRIVKFIYLVLSVLLFFAVCRFDIGGIIWSAVPLAAMYIFRRNRHSISSSRPGHEKIDAQVQELKSNQRQHAMKFLCLEEEELAAQPFLLWGYNFGRNYSGYGDVQGKDGHWRSPEYELDTWIFTEDQIYFHRKTVSLIWSCDDSEKTNSFFYRDIASVRKEATSSSTKFIVTNYAGEKLTCNCYNAELVDQYVVALQSLVKEKKG